MWVQSLGREDSLGEGNGNPPQYSCLENSVNRGPWQATVHGVAESDTTERLSPFPSLMYYNHLVSISRLAEMYLICSTSVGTAFSIF